MKLIILLIALILPLTAADRLVTLAWDAQAEATSFAVYNSAGSLLATSATNEATIVVPDTVPTTVYVTALNEWGESEPSAPLTIRVKPGSPKGLRIVKITRQPTP